MNKYALIFPSVILSFFLGHFASSSKIKYFFAIVTVATVLVTIVGCLLFFKHQRVGDSKRTRKTKVTTAFIVILVFSTLIGVQLVNLAAANPTPVYSLTMPEEFINYTICRINGSLWAKVDGTYPLTKLAIECHDQSGGIDNAWFTFTGDTLPMVYPTPPSTTNISIEVDETKLEWGNYTQNVPYALHYTAIGDWPIISCTIYPVLDQFMLKIHYEHPIMLINGNHTFLYDLNISPYLSPWSNKSAAHFNIRFEIDITDLQAYTIAVDGTLSPVDYTVTEETAAETVSLQVVSEYSQPLPGDLLISFNESEESKQNNSDLLDSSLHSYALVIVTLVALVTIFGYLFLKHKKQGDRE